MEYYSLIDSGASPAHLFDKDFQFYFPKYGVGRGLVEFAELADGARSMVDRMFHRIDDMLILADGNHVVVEGTTEGSDKGGKEWRGGQTPGGRFCSIFSFNSVGLIDRMHVYLDPDYTGQHLDGFKWPNRIRQEW